MAALGCIYEYDDDVYCVLCIVKWEVGSGKWEGREWERRELELERERERERRFMFLFLFLFLFAKRDVKWRFCFTYS